MATIFLAMMARMTIIVVFVLIYLNTSDLYLCISSWVFFVLTSSEVRYIVSHMLLIHPPQQLHWLPRSLSFLSRYCLALWRPASSCASCSTSDDTQFVALYSHSSLPWSPEVESNCGFWQLSKWRSLNLWPEGTLHCHLELLMFIAELPVWIIHRPQFLERCPLFFHTH